MSILYIGGIRLLKQRKPPALPMLQAELPARLSLPVPAANGISAFPTVALGESVLRGQLIAASDSPLLAPLHSPISGTVTQVSDSVIAIQNDHRMELHPACVPFARDLRETTDTELLDFIEGAGLCEQGSSTRSLAAQIRRERGSVHTLLLCAIDDEPPGAFFTHLMTTRTDEILDMLRLLLRLYGAHHAKIVMNADYTGALNHLSRALVGQDMIELIPLKPIYPVSHPRHLVLTLTSREQKRGMRLSDTGYSVFTPDTLLALSDAFLRGLPMIERTLLAAGDCLREPCMITAPIGMPIPHLLRGHGKLKTAAEQIAVGNGQLTAREVEPEQGVDKATRCVFALRHARRRADTFRTLTATPADASACIGCAKCSRVCPSELDIPAILSDLAEGRAEKAARRGSEFCIGCRCCEYACPAEIEVSRLFADLSRAEEETVESLLTVPEPDELILEEAPPANGIEDADLPDDDDTDAEDTAITVAPSDRIEQPTEESADNPDHTPEVVSDASAPLDKTGPEESETDDRTVLEESANADETMPEESSSSEAVFRKRAHARMPRLHHSDQKGESEHESK